jgi:hypothetical protein
MRVGPNIRVVIADDQELVRGLCRQMVLTLGYEPPGARSGTAIPLDDMKRHPIMRTLESMGGDKRLAEKLLGIEKTPLCRKLRK